MQHARFAGTERQVSRLGFGAMGLANWFEVQTPQEHVRSVLIALERGVNFIDTARAYGQSERIVGGALRDWSGAPPFVATKVEALGGVEQWGTPVAVEDAFPRGQVLRSFDMSRRALGLERIDLMQLHTYWPNWGTEGYWLDELLSLKSRNLIGHIGVSIPDHRSDLALPLVSSGNVESVQTVVNIFDPLALEVLVPFCVAHNVAVIARSVLDEGGLTGSLTSTTTFAADDFRSGYFDATIPRQVYLDKIDALKRFIPDRAPSLAALAIKFVLKDAGVTTAITSMQVSDHASLNIEAAEGPGLDDETYLFLMKQHRFIKNYNNTKHFGTP